MYKCNQARLQQTIEHFSQFGATENGGVTRLSLSKEDVLARDYFYECCEELGMKLKSMIWLIFMRFFQGKRIYRLL